MFRSNQSKNTSKFIKNLESKCREQKFRGRRFHEDLELLNIYFWIHGVGFTTMHKCNGIKMFVSIMLSILFDGCSLLTIYNFLQLYRASIMSLKEAISISVLLLVCILQRFVVYACRRNFPAVVQKLSSERSTK